MRLIEIKALDNGAHNNQTINTGTFWGVAAKTFPVPDGWAVIPEGLETPNFPFGEITVDESVPPVVTSWTPGEIPEPEEPVEPETPENDPVMQVYNELDAAYQEGYQKGVDTAYDQ